MRNTLKRPEMCIRDRYQNSQAFMCTMLYNMSWMQTPSMMAAMNELSNHDHSRFLTRTNRQVGRLDYRGKAAASEGINLGIFRAAVVVQMTWPCLLYTSRCV